MDFYLPSSSCKRIVCECPLTLTLVWNSFWSSFHIVNIPIFHLLSFIFYTSIISSFHKSLKNAELWKIWTLPSSTHCASLVYRIEVHARLLILRKKSTLQSLILVCTFIDFEKTFPPARIFHPARLLVSTIFHCCNFFASETEQQSYNSYLLTFIFQSCLLKRFISINFLLWSQFFSYDNNNFCAPLIIFWK